MDAHSVSLNSRALRPLVTVAAAGLLLTGVACNGPLARRAASRQTPSTPVTVVTPTPTTPTPTTTPSATASPVRTDDLEAGLQQADTQLSQTDTAVGDANQNPQQNSD
ncbi:MAG: hypothetical protein JO148_01925 [Acidimicrobiia bacterium]|nr:hypothetical protein [Acidimicrobiia bacterium]